MTDSRDPQEDASPPKRSRVRRAVRLLGSLVALLLGATAAGWIVLVEIPASRLPAMLAALEARGESPNLADLAPPPVAEDDNAAPLLRQAFALEQELIAQMTAEVLAVHGEADADTPFSKTLAHHPYWSAYLAWSDPDSADGQLAAFRENESAARAYLDSRAPVLELVGRALNRPTCNYGRPYDDIQELLVRDIGEYQGLRSIARLLHMRAFVRATDGDPDAALEDCRRIVGLAQSLRGEPKLVDYLVQGAIFPLAVERAERVLLQTEPSPVALRALSQTFFEAADDDNFVHVLRGERAWHYDTSHFFDPFALVWDRMPPDKRKQLTAATARETGWWTSRRFITAHQWHALSAMTRVIDAATLPYPEAGAAVQRVLADYPESEPTFPFFPKATVGGYIHVWKSTPWLHARRRATLRVAGASCALAADLADETVSLDLDALAVSLPIDPFTEMPLRVARTADSLTIYSLGANMRDDGGKNAGRNSGGDPDIADDIAFTIPLPPPAAP